MQRILKLLFPFIEFDILAFRVLSRNKHLTKFIVRGTDFTRKLTLKNQSVASGKLDSIDSDENSWKDKKETNSGIEEMFYPVTGQQ